MQQVASEPSPASDPEPVAADLDPAVRKKLQAECTAAQRQFDAALAAAPDGCATDDDCDIFDRCDPVIRGSSPTLWKLKERAQDVCRKVPVEGDLLSVVGSPCRAARCVGRRCVRR